MKLFYIAVFMVVASLPISTVSLYWEWMHTPDAQRLYRLNEMLQTMGIVYLGMVLGSVVVFLVWLCLPLNKGDVVGRVVSVRSEPLM